MSNLWGVSAAHPDSANPAGSTPCCELGVYTHLWFDATCRFLSPAAALSIKSTTEPVKKKRKRKMKQKIDHCIIQINTRYFLNEDQLDSGKSIFVHPSLGSTPMSQIACCCRLVCPLSSLKTAYSTP